MLWCYMPWLILLIARATNHLLISDPKGYYAAMTWRLPPVDQANLPQWRDNPPPSVIEATIEPYRNGSNGLNRDVYLLVRP